MISWKAARLVLLSSMAGCGDGGFVHDGEWALAGGNCTVFVDGGAAHGVDLHSSTVVDIGAVDSPDGRPEGCENRIRLDSFDYDAQVFVEVQLCVAGREEEDGPWQLGPAFEPLVVPVASATDSVVQFEGSEITSAWLNDAPVLSFTIQGRERRRDLPAQMYCLLPLERL